MDIDMDINRMTDYLPFSSNPPRDEVLRHVSSTPSNFSYMHWGMRTMRSTCGLRSLQGQ